MLPTEAINRIRVLSERGMGSKAIAKSTGISRNTVRWNWDVGAEFRISIKKLELQGLRP